MPQPDLLNPESKPVIGAIVPETGMRTETPSSGQGSPQGLPVCLNDVLERTRKIGLLDDDIVEVVLAAYISKEIEKRNPLWLMLVGNPSSNKTQLVTLLAKARDTYMIDVLTTNPFISGLANKEKPQDLLPLLDGKCFIVKDFTSFFGRSEETVKQLLSDLVSIYDGSFSKHSGSRGTVRYDSVFSHIGCVTPMGLSMRQQYMNMVGPRFLTIRIPALTDMQHIECFDIAWSDDLKAMVDDAAKYASALVTSIADGIRAHGVQLAPVDPEIRKSLNILSQLVARARGEVRTRSLSFEDDEGEKHTYEEVEEVQTEEPFRALHQMKALCRALAILREKEAVSQTELMTAKRVALSSMPVHRAEVLSAFKTEPKLSAKEAADILQKNYKTMKRHLDQLTHLKVLRSEKDTDGKTRLYYPEPRFEPFILK